jgi:hypothetical protein
VTYGDPPDPPAVAAVLAMLAEAARSVRDRIRAEQALLRPDFTP